MIRRFLITSLTLLPIVVAGISLHSCNTMEGAGEDIEAAGESIEEAAE